MIRQVGVCFLRTLDWETLGDNSKWLEQKGILTHELWRQAEDQLHCNEFWGAGSRDLTGTWTLFIFQLFLQTVAAISGSHGSRMVVASPTT